MNEHFKVPAEFEQLVRSYKSEYGIDNTLTEQERADLLRLLRKALAPSMEYVLATTKEEIETAKIMANYSDENLKNDGFKDTLCSTFLELSQNFGFLYGKYAVDHEKEMNLRELENKFFEEYQMPPDFFSKSLLLVHFHSLLIEDPVALIMNYLLIFRSTSEASIPSIIKAYHTLITNYETTENIS
jgi:hypothetical protein